MKNNKYIWIIIVIVAALAVIFFILHEIERERTENTNFISNLRNISQAIPSLAKIDGFQIENIGGGKFSINGNVADPSANEYNTEKPVSLAEFASSTDLSVNQINALINFSEEHPYIEMAEGDVNMGGECAGVNGTLYPCTAIKFYLQQSLLSLWFSSPTTWYSNGYMYIPFTPSQVEQTYLDKYFGSVKEIAPNWYQFSGEHS